MTVHVTSILVQTPNIGHKTTKVQGDIRQRLLITGASIVVSNTSHIDTGIPGGLDLKVGSEKHQR